VNGTAGQLVPKVTPPPLTAMAVTSSGFTFANPASLLRSTKSSCLRVPTRVLP
jgi:hypothetical protein